MVAHQARDSESTKQLPRPGSDHSRASAQPTRSASSREMDSPSPVPARSDSRTQASLVL